MKQDAAARQAALNLASSQQAAEVAAKAAADAPFTLSENQTRFGPKDPVTGKATVLAEGPKKRLCHCLQARPYQSYGFCLSGHFEERGNS